MIIELIIAGGAALIGGKVGHFFGKRKKKVVRPDDGSIAYSWKKHSTTTRESVWGFACPKCPRVQGENRLKFCDCMEYSEGHFHFECNACGFKAIMRSKDAG